MVITRISTRILARCVQTQFVRPFTNRRISSMAFSPSLLLEDRLHVVSELCAKHGVPLPSGWPPRSSAASWPGSLRRPSYLLPPGTAPRQEPCLHPRLQSHLRPPSSGPPSRPKP